MSETVSFWLDNKMSSGILVARIGSQTLVSYREKFYVIENGDAQAKGSRPLHYSKTSMPSHWKKAIKGIAPQEDAGQAGDDAPLPQGTRTGKARPRVEKAPVEEPAATLQQPSSPLQEISAQQESTVEPVKVKASKTPKRTEPKPVVLKPALQVTVSAACPYCDQKHDLSVEKGKNGKPFFVSCPKCGSEFAVRFVQVSMYQAQVAGFI